MVEGFGATVRAERQRMKMSLREFAGLIGVSVSTIKRWEAGTGSPSEAQREAVSQTLAQGERYAPPQFGMHLGWWLRLARHAHRVSIRRAGELSEIAPSAWHRFETGQTRIGVQQASRLAVAIGGQTLDSGSKNLQTVLHAIGTAALDQPQVRATELLAALLRQEKSSIHNLAGAEQTCQALVTLARSLMQLGDHDLCGQAYLAAFNLGKKAGLDPEMFAAWQLSSIWTGYPAIRFPRFAGARLAWLEKKLTLVNSTVRNDHGIMRSMFMDWAGYPSLSQELLQRQMDGPVGGTLPSLMLAWFEAKHGDPLVALRDSEPCFESADVSMAFLARKVALEACFQNDDFHGAMAHYSALESIREHHGYWSPDLALRRKQLVQRLSQ